MKIFLPRGLTKGHVVLCSILGVFGGVYIWRPLLDQHLPKGKKEIDTRTENH